MPGTLRVGARGACIAALSLLACACLPASASATSETATLHAAFTPDRLGASTTISFGFHIATSEGLAPPPLTSLDLRMPAGIDYATTTLGLAICQPAALEAKGVAGCPPNSRLGFGSAYVEVPFGADSGHELPEIQALMGPPHDGNLVVLFYANGQTPVEAHLVFTGRTAAGLRGLWLAACDGSPADRERPRRSRRVGRERAEHDRPEPAHLLPPQPRAARGLPPRGRQRARTLSAPRLPVLREVQLPGRLQHAGEHDRAVSPRRQPRAPSMKLPSEHDRSAGDRSPPESRDGPVERLAIACVFVGAALRYWLVVYPVICLELRRWRGPARRIPDPTLRRAARDARRKRANIEGTAAVAAIARGRRRLPVVRAVVSFQAIYDYVDLLAEQLQRRRPPARRAMPARRADGGARAGRAAARLLRGPRPPRRRRLSRGDGPGVPRGVEAIAVISGGCGPCAQIRCAHHRLPEPQPRRGRRGWSAGRACRPRRAARWRGGRSPPPAAHRSRCSP